MPKLAWVLLYVLFTPDLRGTSLIQNHIVCEFGNPAFEGHLVTIAARITYGRHGGSLMSLACNNDSTTAAILFPGTDEAPKVKFQSDHTTLERLRPFFRLNGGVASACGTLTGQIFSKKKVRVRDYGGGLQGNGYGARGLARFAFVIQSVDNIRACD